MNFFGPLKKIKVVVFYFNCNFFPFFLILCLFAKKILIFLDIHLGLFWFLMKNGIPISEFLWIFVWFNFFSLNEMILLFYHLNCKFFRSFLAYHLILMKVPLFFSLIVIFLFSFLILLQKNFFFFLGYPIGCFDFNEE